MNSCQNPPECTTAATIVDPDTGEVIRWFEMPDPDLFTACVQWSPDGNRLACEAFGNNDPALNGIYSLDATDGSDLTRVTSNSGGEDLPGDYSPDGSRIVFLRAEPDRPERRSEALFIAEVDGSRQAGTHYALGPTEEPGSWSPDGDTILFAGAGVLYTVSANEGTIKRIRLARPGAAFDPVWSPNGRKIAFALYRRATSQSDIWTARANGRGMQQITQTVARSTSRTGVRIRQRNGMGVATVALRFHMPSVTFMMSRSRATSVSGRTRTPARGGWSSHRVHPWF